MLGQEAHTPPSGLHGGGGEEGGMAGMRSGEGVQDRERSFSRSGGRSNSENSSSYWSLRRERGGNQGERLALLSSEGL